MLGPNEMGLNMGHLHCISGGRYHIIEWFRFRDTAVAAPLNLTLLLIPRIVRRANLLASNAACMCLGLFPTNICFTWVDWQLKAQRGQQASLHDTVIKRRWGTGSQIADLMSLNGEQVLR
jgi:hypothetical protein